MGRPKLLLLLCGRTMDTIARDHGDFADWFATGLGDCAVLTSVNVRDGEAVPDMSGFDGLLISGSLSSVLEWESWMDAVAAAVEAAMEGGMPVLGVCFGHQVLGKVLGGKVERNPAGREMGTVDVEVTRAGRTDPVLGPFFPVFKAQATHVDSVVEPPAGAVVLAFSELEGCAAMRVGKNVYGVQFHPEITAPVMRRYIHARSRQVDGERVPGTARRLLGRVSETRSGRQLLKRFVEKVVEPYAARRMSTNGDSRKPIRQDGLYRETTTTAADGSPIFYNRIGHGDPAMVMCAGIGCAQFAWKHMVPSLRRDHSVIRWHYPGHGRTPAPTGWPDMRSPRLSIEGMADDTVRVMDHAGLERAILFGHSMGVQVVLETWNRHPSRVQGMVLVCGSYGRPLTTFHDNAALDVAFPFVYRLVRVAPKVSRMVWTNVLRHDIAYRFATLVEVNGRLVKRPDFKPYFEEISAVDAVLFTEMLSHAKEHTAESYLRRINVPTLIVAGEHDTFTPQWLSQEMHVSIPGSEMLTVPTGTHTAPIELPELVGLRVDKWLARHFKGGSVVPARLMSPALG